MESFKIVKFALIFSVVFLAKTAKATSLEFDFYNGETYAVMFNINDCIAKKVQIDNNKKQTDTTANKLNSIQKRNKVTLGGYVYNYNPETKSGCLFTDLEMVASGLVSDISDELTNGCFSEKYGFGVYIYFGEVSSKNYYKKPIEGLLMNYYGTWELDDDKYVFHVQEIQPFF